MGKKLISITLSENEIDNAIKELQNYKQDFIKKVKLFQQKVSEYVANEVQQGFSNALSDDIIKGSKKYADVKVTIENNNEITLIIAEGEDVIWVEFGAGVYHNSSLGSSPHPNGVELGFTIGSYGKGNGKKSIWGFYEDGELKLTRGTPAKMPMANAITSVCNDITKIAQEVFR